MFGVLSKALLVVGAMAMIASATAPAYLVAVYSILRPMIQPFAFLQYKAFGLPISFPLSILIISIGFSYFVFRKNWRVNPTLLPLFTLVIAFSSVLTIFSENFVASMAAIVKLLTAWFIMNIAFNAIRGERDIRVLLYGLIFSSAFPLAVGFYQAATGQYDFLLDATVDRLSSVFGVGNAYGIFLSLITAALATLLLGKVGKKEKMFLFAVLLMVLVSQVLALNRGTWIALTGGLIVAAFRYRRLVNLKWILGLFAVLVLAFSSVIIERFSELETRERWSGMNTAEGRIEYWKKIIPLIADKPIIGYGLGTTAEVVEKRFGSDDMPHNDFVRLALEIGVIGALLYFVFLARIVVYFLTRPVSSPIWHINFSMLMISSYFIVISMAQNIVFNLINFPIFLILVAIGVKANILSSKAVPRKKHSSATVRTVDSYSALNG